MSEAMSDVWASGKLGDQGICAECGRGQGWHDVWCSVLRRGITAEVTLRNFVEDSAVVVIQKLGEVE